MNPLDCAMTRGYGSAVIGAIHTARNASLCNASSANLFPLTPGRDFSGVVEDVGHGVHGGEVRPGDEVWGATFPGAEGSHGDYIIADSAEVSIHNYSDNLGERDHQALCFS